MLSAIQGQHTILNIWEEVSRWRRLKEILFAFGIIEKNLLREIFSPTEIANSCRRHRTEATFFPMNEGRKWIMEKEGNLYLQKWRKLSIQKLPIKTYWNQFMNNFEIYYHWYMFSSNTQKYCSDKGSVANGIDGCL